MDDDFPAKPPETDLLGDPWTEARDPRGRKRHKRSTHIAEKVAVLRGSGLTEEQIAVRAELSVPTLRKYYFRELRDGATLADAVLTEAMWEKAKGGNVAAARYVKEAFVKGSAAVPIGKPAPPPSPAAEKPEKLGKKATAAEAAHDAHKGSEWGPLLNKPH